MSRNPAGGLDAAPGQPVDPSYSQAALPGAEPGPAIHGRSRNCTASGATQSVVLKQPSLEQSPARPSMAGRKVVQRAVPLRALFSSSPPWGRARPGHPWPVAKLYSERCHSGRYSQAALPGAEPGPAIHGRSQSCTASGATQGVILKQPSLGPSPARPSMAGRETVQRAVLARRTVSPSESSVLRSTGACWGWRR
ncbi:hypothetical protein SAMN04487965_0347 [Microbulbifer donghaiensis]|uniref:Uncharacterized protein n=1 Tax=Microbulbifer donghaiensis TaxID=494016 RepID=A0A1M4V7W2_9GAMM|nr:hypothetical protein SAMN04487965_0347 [Microbulbifer donghaiensis]